MKRMPVVAFVRSLFASVRDHDFAEAIRGELTEMRVPAADDRLLARIRASRSAGARVILPLDDVPRRRRPIIAVSAIAVAALVVFLIGRTRRAESPGLLPGNESWFGGDVAHASAPQTRYASARITRADRMRPMEIRYDRSVRDSTGNITHTDSHLTVTRDSVGGVAAWRLVARRVADNRAVEVDSVWVSPETFAPLRQTIAVSPYRSYGRIIVWQRFSGLRVRGEMNAFRNGALSARRTFDRRLVADFAPYVADAFVPLYHIGVALDGAWAGRVSVLGWLVREDNVYASINLRVDGEEVVRVPAGVFPCWRLAVDHGGRVRWYWVRKSDGLGVRMLDSASVRGGVRDIVLRSAISH